MDINAKNYFELFGLPQSFRLELEPLRKQYQALQGQYHPDKQIGADDRQRRLALQYTSYLNEAYETLRSPLKRAAYLLSLNGIDPEENVQADLGAEFLFQQMQLREELENIAASESLDDLDAMKGNVDAMLNGELTEFAAKYETGAFAAARPVYKRLQFLFKLRAEIDQAEEKLLDY